MIIITSIWKGLVLCINRCWSVACCFHCCVVVLLQEVEFVLAPGQELYSLKFDVVFTNNIALSYFIGKLGIITAHGSDSSIVFSVNTITWTCTLTHQSVQDLVGDQYQHPDPGTDFWIFHHCEIGQTSLLAGLQKKLWTDLLKIFR